MRIKEIYHKYKILPTLQKHQYKVAAVGKLIALNSKKTVRIYDIVATCLLHDMGNIIKFSFDYMPESYQPEGVDYWMEVKNDYIKRYGKEEHDATLLIAKELGVSKRVLHLLKNVGFDHTYEVYKANDLEMMICSYADHRVAPSGILPLEERVREGIARFKLNKPEYNNPKSDEKRDELLGYFKLIEKEIFRNSNIQADSVNNDSVKPLFDDFVMNQDFVI